MEQFKEFERKAWEDKAHRYEATWGTVSTQAIEPVLERVLDRPEKSTILLDIGCGPGHLSAAAAKRGAKPTGCDLSNGMIAIARNNYPSLNFDQADAERLQYPDGAFDAVVMNFLLLHVPDQQQVLKEAARVLKPGGRLAFTVWDSPPNSPGLQLMFGAVKQFGDLNVIPPAQDIFVFADRRTAEDFLTEIGFSAVEIRTLATYWQVQSGRQFFEAVQAGTRIGGIIDRQQPEVKAKIEAQICKEIEKFKTASGYHLPTPALMISAVKS